MTDSDLRELDGWIAVRFMGWTYIPNSYPLAWVDYAGKITTWETTSYSDAFQPTRLPAAFALVKREIERRGGSWNCRFDKAVKQHGDWPYWFTIWMPNLDQSVSAWGQTEELAGCLAVKAAVEAISSSIPT